MATEPLPTSLDATLQAQLIAIIDAALAEDIGPGDYTTLATIPPGVRGRARCLIKDSGTLAGVQFAALAFQRAAPGHLLYDVLPDGALVQPGQVAFEVAAEVRHLLQLERLVLNVMQRMSGIATATRLAVDAVAGTACKILDTRKTSPLLRVLEKWAVRIGGGHNHRMGLYDRILIKDNHIDYAGGIPQALEAVQHYLALHGLSLPVEIETRNLQEVAQVLQQGGAQCILLDNMTTDQLRQAVQLIAGRVETEASGSMRLERLAEVAATGVTYISMGASLTHSVKSLDISLKAIK